VKENFKSALKFVMEHECVFERGHYGDFAHVIPENVSGDSGGLTKFGIDQASHPNVDIKRLDYSGAAAIYRDNEWTLCRCDELPAGYDVAVFDIAVNNGRGTAAKLLQRALNAAGGATALEVDGFIGAKTIAAAQRIGEKGTAYLLQSREQLYYDIAHNHPTQKKFLNGWLDRNRDLYRCVAAALVPTLSASTGKAVA
jgi:lysozyme family protein